MKKTLLFMTVILLMMSSVAMAVDIPKMMNYQGYAETASGSPLTGDGYFKFAIIDDPTSPTATYWCNDCSGTSAGVTVPTSSVTVPITNGVFTVKLGATGMSPLTEDVFQNQSVYIRVWFSDDSSTFEQMSPDTQIISSAFAYKAQTVAADAVTSSAIADGSITSADINSTNLDSDTLDELDSTAFATSAHDHTWTDVSNRPAGLDDGDDVGSGGVAPCDQACVNDFEARIAALETLLSDFTKVGNDVIITGNNLHVRSNGSSTDDVVDGTGNIIIGFNEPRGTGSDKTGSHNLIVGRNHNYSSYGGIVIGFQNTISAAYASVSGGEINTASSTAASVSGGAGNTASGIDASVSGGQLNTASSTAASVSGGEGNTASSTAASVSGGNSNTASGVQSSVSGGLSHESAGDYDWRAGTLFEEQ